MSFKKIILILILSPVFSIAQNIKGIVIAQKSRLPIEDVNVAVKKFNVSSVTDKKGEFNINISTGFQENDTLYFSHVGYLTKKVLFSELKKNNFLISIDQNIEYLDGITLSANKKLKAKLSFTKLTPLKHALSSFGSILKDSKIYIIGGDASFKTDAWKKVTYENPDPTMEDYLRELRFQFSGQSYKGDLLVYDIKTNHWETSTLKFRKRAHHNLNYFNNTIYVIGGKRTSKNGKFEFLDDTIEVFSMDKKSIAIDNTNPHQAADFSSFTYNDNIIVLGGSLKMNDNGAKVYSNKVHSYNINSGYWYQLTDMPTAKETDGVLIKNKIYLIGGFNTKPLSTIESFDLLTEKWQTEGELFRGMEKPAIAYNETTIYFFENERIYTYNIETKELKEYLISLPMKASKLHLSDNKLFLLGGYIENDYSKYPSPNLFSIDINEFENTNPSRYKIL
ncbi:carboxypeptidase-like regulatory domain-containing protein [Flavobacterium sp. XS2P39]|uniref:Kelch repeat-containing protein n=1 Tax=Flavobacterium sp. XS2P39 TaxID=3401725 RepID=UPI003AAC528C